MGIKIQQVVIILNSKTVTWAELSIVQYSVVSHLSTVLRGNVVSKLCDLDKKTVGSANLNGRL